MKSSRNLWFVLILFVFIILLFVGVWFSPGRVLFRDPQALSAWLTQWGAWVPLVTIGLHIVQVLSAPIPGTAIDATNGYLFGPWLGTLYSMICLITGSMVLLILVRHYGRPLAERFIPAKRLQSFNVQVARYGAIFIFLIFLLPFMPDDVMLIVAGLTSIPLMELFLLALIGRLPGVFVANWLGSHSGDLSGWQWAILAFLFILLMILFWRFRHILVDRMETWAEKISSGWQNRKKKN